jgi:hypothetical protein
MAAMSPGVVTVHELCQQLCILHELVANEIIHFTNIAQSTGLDGSENI